ncbi:lantibiotic dehydratase [Kribbella sp. NBC_01505]|uniref:lantibiotic dehydratase n=1 Tax=Kribbella sp. NBC_01505 TaxID=2903580 RepID=UPI00386AB60D
MYRPLDWVMVRTPLLPVEAFLDPPTAIAPGTELPADPRIQRALAVGAGDLARALAKPPGTGKPQSEKALRRMRSSLQRYLIRMATRPTPYGTFAGVAVAQWGETTDLAMTAEPVRIRTRPDMGWLIELIAELEQRPEVRAELRWYTNPAASLHADRLFLTERAVLTDPGEAARGVNLRATPVVRAALEAARTPVRYEELLGSLAAGGAPRDKVAGLLQQLWEQTVLLTDLRPPITIEDPARYVADRLTAIPAARAEAVALTELLDEIADWDRLDVGHAAAEYPKLVAKAKTLRDTATQFQTDMAIPLEGGITREVAAESARLAELLLRLSPTAPGTSYLDGYRQAFQERYGREREVPLLELLDPELGLGVPQPLERREEPTDAKMLRDRTLVDLALSAIKDGQTVVELDDAMVGKLSLGAGRPSDSLDLSVFVVAASAAAVDAGDFRLMIGPNLGGGAAGRVLGRFADLVGVEPLRAAAAAEAERNPGLLRAEVSYLARHVRAANVTIRPLVREREIALTTTPGDDQLPPDELLVGLSGDRFVLRWAVDGREVVPCAGHMLNTNGAPELVSFLEHVYHDGRMSNVGFSWGPAAGFPFLPRVQRGRLVLAPASWRLEPTDLGAFPVWRERWQVPRYVYMADKDNRLLLDLDNPEHVDQLRAKVRDRTVLQEALPSPDDAWVSGPEGNYLSELVVPLVLDEPVSQPTRRSAAVRRTDTSRRLRPPGSDWLYAKLYDVPAYEDDLIAHPIREFGAQAIADGTADSWFFMRYVDPDPHLRIRWHGDPAVLTEKLAPRLLSWGAELVNAGYCKSFGLDTYDQEVERYGGAAGIELAEQLFHTDSELVAELLRQRRSLDMLLLGVYTVDTLLGALGYDPAERESLARIGVQDRKATADEFRKEQVALRGVLGDPSWLPVSAQPAVSMWSKRIAEIAKGLTEAELDKDELTQSYVHMHCNRLLGCGHPPEQRVRGLLVRTRESLARAPWRPR